MKNVIYLLIKYGAHFLFLGLEVLCFYLIINYNQSQKEIFINSSNVFASQINKRLDRFEEYVRLELVNDSLQRQNGELIKRFINSPNLNFSNLTDSLDINGSQYNLIPTALCNSTFRLKNNYVTLCQGAVDGITKDMGVISLNGIVGQVTDVSPNFSKVMSILHSQTRISAAIKRNNAYGSLRWPGSSPLEMSLEAIPKHVDILVGDTVITSGFSTIFPKGIDIGIVTELKKKNNNHQIKVNLFNDPTNWDVMFGVENILSREQLSLENPNEI
jgi:rod shape-determining protein MreC